MKQLTEGQGTSLPYRRILINKYGRNKGNKKSPLECHSNNWYRQNPLVDANTGEWKLKAGTGYTHGFKVAPSNMH